MVIAKDTRYDRQLRLWGNHGQKALESAKICLINGSATGTEILKNLILPGVGSVTIVDGNLVTERDCGNNFFVTQDSIGKPRAQVVALLLQELNMEVKTVRAVTDHIGTVLDCEPDFFAQFTCVILTQTAEALAIRVADDLWTRSIPLVVVRSFGLMGYMRLCVRNHIVIDAHPDQPAVDLRLDAPFPELTALASSMGDIAELTINEHKHIPYPIILLYHLHKWKESHDGALPKSSKEKKEFKSQLQNAVLIDSDGNREDEENYEEAFRNARHAWTPTSSKKPHGLLKMFENSACDQVGQARDSSAPAITSEWFIVRALRDFVEEDPHGLLPLLPVVPDVTASTKKFLDLQNAYKEKADRDISEVVGRVNALLERTSGQAPTVISEDEIKSFCRHAYEVEVQTGTSLKSEYTNADFRLSDQMREISQNNLVEWNLYLALRAVDAFNVENGRNPNLDDVAADVYMVKLKAQQLLDLYGLPTPPPDQFIEELCRWNGSEMHSIASVMGGLGSQEVIKVITQQFVPLDNTLIYNAIDSTSCAWKL